MEIADGGVKLEMGLFAELPFCGHAGSRGSENRVMNGENLFSGIVDPMDRALYGNVGGGSRGCVLVGMHRQVGVRTHIANAARPGGNGCAVECSGDTNAWISRIAHGLLHGTK